MNRIMIATAMILLFIFGFTLSGPMARGISSQDQEVPLVGTTVRDSQREDIGKVIDIVRGPEGHAAFAIISYWVSDDTLKRVAVPLDALSCGEGTCLLHASRSSLESAPPLITESDLMGPKMAEDVYRYFGVQPYWTEDATEK